MESIPREAMPPREPYEASERPQGLREVTPRGEKMSRSEAGRKGGLSTKRRYGGDHFSKIGRMGGKKGGESTKRRYGIDFYKTIGRKGGSA